MRPNIGYGLVVVLGSAALVFACYAAEPQLGAKSTSAEKSGITFTISEGSDNGSLEILDKRKAQIAEKKGDKLSGHDWWLWGLTGIDYDRDGDTDLIVTIHGPAGNGVFLKNQFAETGKVTFTNVTQELGVDWKLPSAEGRRTFVWDFDGDGWLDFSGLHTPDFLNQAGKAFQLTTKKSFGTFNPQEIVDLNGDGHPDAYNASGFNGIWNPAKQIFEVTPFTHPLKDKVPEAVQALWLNTKEKPQNRFLRVAFLTDHDLNGDGKPEAIVTGYGSYGGDSFGRVLQQKEDDQFVDVTEKWGLPLTGTPILMEDLDGDGWLDLLIAATPESGFFRNNGLGRFTLQPGPLTDPHARSVLAPGSGGGLRSRWPAGPGRLQTTVRHGGDFRQLGGRAVCGTAQSERLGFRSRGGLRSERRRPA